MKTNEKTTAKPAERKSASSSKKMDGPNPGKPGNKPDMTPDKEITQKPVAKPSRK